ncbi:MAG: hypothetical protein LBU53_07025 [Zoogloeaceae bacterium]|jgi:hypothetical protein|nr:hypothetical protein [Zoogloeaceae bacterium]
MPENKRIACLANSRKLNGRCIAGIELSGNRRLGWIRPVSSREHEEVSEYERQYSDGSDPRLLDIIDVPLLEARPKGYQQENWLLDPQSYWVKAGRISWSELVKLTELPEPLWINGDSTYNGANDKIRLELAESIRSSLRLIHVPILVLSVFKPGEAFGNSKRRVQARFQYLDCEYRLWVTDPIYERLYLAKPDAEYTLGECYLTVSLGESYNEVCYKLVAAIIEKSKVER